MLGEGNGSMLIKKGAYVRIRKNILPPGKRAKGIPEDTTKVPFKCWIKGRLLEEGELYEEARIQTATGRVVTGEIKEVEPRHKHSYGDHVDEILTMRETILREAWGDDDEKL